MQENRSFDQVLGYLSRDGMLPRNKLLNPPAYPDEGLREPAQLAETVEGLLPGDNERDKIAFPEGGNQYYRSQRRTTTAWPRFDLPNPCHGHACVERQVSDNMAPEVRKHVFEARMYAHKVCGAGAGPDSTTPGTGG